MQGSLVTPFLFLPCTFAPPSEIPTLLINNYDYVICGHIHQPVIRDQIIKGKKITYLNSGDWIENLTSLEYNNNRWKLFEYDPNNFRHLKKERNSTIDK